METLLAPLYDLEDMHEQEEDVRLPMKGGFRCMPWHAPCIAS